MTDNLLKIISKENKRLIKILKSAGVSAEVLNLQKNLISENAFISVQLQELKKNILEKGVVEEYKNGENQFGKKKSTEIDIYNNLIKHFISINKQLLDLIPKTETGENAKKEFEMFISSKP